MRTLVKLIALTTIVFAFNTQAKSLIKRIDPEVMDKSQDVAMAIETYDGEFYDLSEFAKARKYRGNAEDILKEAAIQLKTGEEIGVNAIRYFFVEKKQTKINKTVAKMPQDEE